jgi:hypothetical protein
LSRSCRHSKATRKDAMPRWNQKKNNAMCARRAAPRLEEIAAGGRISGMQCAEGKHLKPATDSVSYSAHPRYRSGGSKAEAQGPSLTRRKSRSPLIGRPSCGAAGHRCGANWPAVDPLEPFPNLARIARSNPCEPTNGSCHFPSPHHRLTMVLSSEPSPADDPRPSQ